MPLDDALQLQHGQVQTIMDKIIKLEHCLISSIVNSMDMKDYQNGHQMKSYQMKVLESQRHKQQLQLSPSALIVMVMMTVIRRKVMMISMISSVIMEMMIKNFLKNVYLLN